MIHIYIHINIYIYIYIVRKTKKWSKQHHHDPANEPKPHAWPWSKAIPPLESETLKHHHRTCYSTSTSHAQRRRILKNPQDPPELSAVPNRGLSKQAPVITRGYDKPYDKPVRSRAPKGSELTMTLATTDSHWHILPWYSWYFSRFALRFKKVTPSHHILSSHFTKGRFLCENNEIARKKEQVPDFGSKVAGLLLCLLVCESASCFFYGRAGKPITDQYQSLV